MYKPAEDSFLLSKQIESYLSEFSKQTLGQLKILDMGSGSGIQAQTCINFGAPNNNVLCADIESEAIYHLKSQGLNTLKSDLFENIKSKFDIILFNPPYLPSSDYDKQKDTTGGKKGDETIIKFLKQSKKHLTKEGTILLLTSSLTPMKRINQLIQKLGFNKTNLIEQKLPFEKLFVYKLNSVYHPSNEPEPAQSQSKQSKSK